MHRQNRLGIRVLLVVVLAVGLSGWSPVRSQDGQSVRLDEIGSGQLLRRGETGWVPLPMLDMNFELTVTGIMLHGKLTQRFHNPTAEVIEALYVFPLPDGAAVHAMELTIGERRIAAEIRVKEQARREYERARTAGRKAALLEQGRSNLFTTAAANINPGETVSVVLEYVGEAEWSDGTFGLRLPLTFTPPFAPAAREGDLTATQCLDVPFAHARDSAAPTVSITVRLQAGLPLAEVTSRSHTLEVERQGRQLKIRPEGGGVVANRDFLLEWRPELIGEPRAAVFVEERLGERYAMMMLFPPIPGSAAGLGLATETLFVIDVSGSMRGPSIRQAREALLAALDRLRPEDRFNILKFNQHSEPFRSEFLQADPEALDTARAWVRDLEAGGGTMIYPALTRGLAMTGASRSSHAQRIVFLTDGAVSNEQEVLRAVSERLGRIRLHTIGIGAAPNAYLMRKMARLGHGLCEFIVSSAEAENRIDAFFARLDRPVLNDVRLEGDLVPSAETFPRDLPDLHAGEPLLLSSRLDPGVRSGGVTLGGYCRTGWIDTTVEISDTTPGGPGIALRWARARVESLLDTLHEGAEEGPVREAVIELALDHSLVTRYTSLVAVEQEVTALGDATTLRVASVLPRGGTDGPLRLRWGLLLAILGAACLWGALRGRA